MIGKRILSLLINAHQEVLDDPSSFTKFLKLACLLQPEYNRSSSTYLGTDHKLFSDYFYLALVCRGFKPITILKLEKFKAIPWINQCPLETLTFMMPTQIETFESRNITLVFKKENIQRAIAMKKHYEQFAVKWFYSDSKNRFELAIYHTKMFGEFLGYPPEDMEFELSLPRKVRPPKIKPPEPHEISTTTSSTSSVQIMNSVETNSVETTVEKIPTYEELANEYFQKWKPKILANYTNLTNLFAVSTEIKKPPKFFRDRQKALFFVIQYEKENPDRTTFFVQVDPNDHLPPEMLGVTVA